MEGFNVFGGSCGAKARIGIIANNEIGCGSCPDSTFGFGIGGGDLAVSNSTCGNAAAYGQQADNAWRPGSEGHGIYPRVVTWGWRALKKFLYVEALPQGATPYPFMHHFS